MSGKIAIVGSGVIGRSWAAVFARAGHEVALHDADPQSVTHAVNWLRSTFEQFARLGTDASVAAVMARVCAASSMEEALDGAIYVQESVAEQVDVKAAVYADMDSIVGSDAILASSSSALSASSFTENLAGRNRCLIAHPTNPPHLVPLVELSAAPWTDEDAMATATKLMRAVDQVPVRINEEVPGFVLNRLQAAVINEGMSLVGRGVISAADLDRVMKHGLGLRWSFMGPFETMDLNSDGGFAGYIGRFKDTFRALGDDLRVAEPWTERAIKAVEDYRRDEVPLSQIRARQRWRDENLIALRLSRH